MEVKNFRRSHEMKRQIPDLDKDHCDCSNPKGNKLERNGTVITSGAQLAIVYRKIGELTPYANNPRTHSKAQIRKIEKSLKRFGFVNPILIDADLTIIAGHGRLEAAKLLGLEEVPTIRLDALTEAEVRAYVIADNRLALDAGWDEDILRIELQNLALETDIDILLTGFEIAEIDQIIIGDVPVSDKADELPPELPDTVTQLGDLWLLGDHRVFNGDAREERSFATLMGDLTASAVFTDPPYNVVIDGHASGNGQIHHREFAMASGEMDEAEFTAFLSIVINNLAGRSANGSLHYICMDFRHMRELLAAGQEAYDTLLNLCVWAKNTGGMGSFYRSQHELVFVFRKGKGPSLNNVQLGKFGRNRTNVWNYPGVNTLSRTGEEGNLLTMHPTVKPVALIADALLDCSARGEIVLDAFLGSGSTLLAATRIGRVCFGMELDSRYVDLAIRRWQKFTGEDAVHSTTKLTFNEMRGRRGWPDA
jgi:DNA modification methylase